MKWGASCSNLEDFFVATKNIINDIRKQLNSTSPDLVLLFTSNNYSSKYSSIHGLINKELKPKQLIGCSTSGILYKTANLSLSNDGICVIAGLLPDCQISSFEFTNESLCDTDSSREEWIANIGVNPADNQTIIVFTDPYSFKTESVLSGLDYVFPSANIIGGILSGESLYEDKFLYALFKDEQVRRSGAVGIIITGNFVTDQFECSGYRVISGPYIVKESENRLISKLNSRQPGILLSEVFQRVDSETKELMKQDVYVGIVTQTESSSENLLVQRIVAIGDEDGSLLLDKEINEGSEVYFLILQPNLIRKEITNQLKLSAKQKKLNSPPLLAFTNPKYTEYIIDKNANSEKTLPVTTNLIGCELGGIFKKRSNTFELKFFESTTYITEYSTHFVKISEKQKKDTQVSKKGKKRNQTAPPPDNEQGKLNL